MTEQEARDILAMWSIFDPTDLTPEAAERAYARARRNLKKVGATSNDFALLKEAKKCLTRA